MFISSLRSASHVPRVPSIKFLGRNRSPHVKHEATFHPAAPQSIIDAFPSFLKKLSASTKLNSTTPAAPSAPTKSKSSINYQTASEWDLPLRMQRVLYKPTEEEIEAVESGGASAAPLVTKASRHSWYNAAKLN